MKSCSDLLGLHLSPLKVKATQNWNQHQHNSMVSCQKGPTHHAYAWQIGLFWQDTLELSMCKSFSSLSGCIEQGCTKAYYLHKHRRRKLQLPILHKMPKCHGHWRSLTHWGRDKMAVILQTTHSNAFSCMKIYEFCLKVHWSFFS